MNMETWTVIIIAADGTSSVTGPFASEYAATLWANDHENDDTGWTCYVRPLESPETIKITTMISEGDDGRF